MLWLRAAAAWARPWEWSVGHNQGLPDAETALGLFPPGCPTSLVSVLFLGLSWSTGWAL